MFNPLLPDYSTLKNSELEDKINDLAKKYNSAAKFGQGSVCYQISVILDALKEEQRTRQQNLVAKTQSDQNKNLDNLININ